MIHSEEFGATIRKWLTVYATNYKFEVAPDTIQAYKIGLAGIPYQELEIAFEEAMKQHQKTPNVAQIISLVDRRRERQRGGSYRLSDPNCPKCEGNGYYLEDHPEGNGYKWAKKCSCWERPVESGRKR